MSRRLHKLLLVFIALALAVSPLRGALALSAMSAEDGVMHCTNMHDGMQTMDHMAAMQDTTADNPGPGCDQGCDGDCCDGACKTCAHGSVALLATMAVMADLHDMPLKISVSQDVSGRTVLPPFRPPIFLQS